MKKATGVLIIALLLAVFAPFSFLVGAEGEGLPVWDGSVAKGFAGGDGSEDDPYRIETAAQLAYFCNAVNSGSLPVAPYVKLCADIRLNDETFRFVAETGVVSVFTNDSRAYYGTGLQGKNEKASVKGVWYDDNYQEIDGYSGKLNRWTPIGTLLNRFQGVFDGGGHTIYGLFIDANEATIPMGLFSSIDNAEIINLHIENSLICGGSYTGAVVGQLDYALAYMKNCSSDAIVIGHDRVGGVIGGVTGNGSAPIHISLLQNAGTVIGRNQVGGVCGTATGIGYCLNKGSVYGTYEVGGICGLYTGRPGINGCANHGMIVGQNRVGGICGTTNASALGHHNTAKITGKDYVGGIIGYTAASQCEKSQNTGQITGNDYVGGICGRGAASFCVNHGKVSGNDFVGGICGRYSATNCQNKADVTGKIDVGGVVGMGIAFKYSNYGGVTGTENVGGIVGQHASETSGSIEKCYNRGAVTAASNVGGIVGLMENLTELLDCYNVALVKGSTFVGGIAGRCKPSGLVQNCYYAADRVSDVNGVRQSGIGCENTASPAPDAEGVLGCKIDKMRQQATYEGFDFSREWTMTDSYPFLQSEAKLSHTLQYKSDARYLYKGATCANSNGYFISCTCGSVKEDVFFDGEPQGHGGRIRVSDAYTHGYQCLTCHEIVEQSVHVYEEKYVSTVNRPEGLHLALQCTECYKVTYIPITSDLLDPDEPNPPDGSDGQDPPTAPTIQTPRVEFKLDMRFFLLLVAGVVLGAMGCYGAMVVRDLKRARKNKRTDFL